MIAESVHTPTSEKEMVARAIHAGLLARVDCPCIDRIFDEPRRRRLARLGKLHPVVLTPANFEEHRREAGQIEVLFSTWDVPADLLTPHHFPSLRVLFYTGGSVKHFALPFMKNGGRVVSAREANAFAVAYFCLSQIILSCKGYFRNTQLCRDRNLRLSGTCFVGAGVYGETVALLGMGAVARQLVALLKPFDLKILVVDPYLSQEDASDLGVERVTTEQAFARAYVVSNHLPNLPGLQRVLNAPLFASMRPHATFINTGRGMQVNEDDLIGVFARRTDLTALLDVTDPEFPLPGSPLYTMPNIQLSGHMAGAYNDEILRQGDFVIEEYERYVSGLPLRYEEQVHLQERLA